MTTQPDIIWNEQCLGIRIGEQVCTYLKKHDAEYQRLQKKILELTEKYPVIETFMESNQSISLTEEEHKAEYVETLAAKMILGGKVGQDDTIVLDVTDGELTASVQSV